MRRILLSTLKIVVSAALLYFSLRKVDLAELVARIDVSSLGWIGVAIAVTFLQIFVGVLRWREISAECGAPLPTRQAMRFNVIGTFFNQTLPSSIGGDAVRLWLVARSGHGWRAATYSIFVDRAIGLIALAVVIVASLPWSYRLITDPHGRSALLFVAKIFLGDVGSLPIGLLAGWCLLQLAWQQQIAAALLLPLYYLADATVTLVRRMARREPFWAAHRSHFYQRATDNGFSVSRVVGEVFALNGLLAALAIASAMTSSTATTMLLLIVGGIATALLMRRFSRRLPPSG